MVLSVLIVFFLLLSKVEDCILFIRRLIYNLLNTFILNLI